jgi:hypothetical protein
MVGRIQSRHLLTHSPTIIHEFGIGCYFRCVWRTLVARRAVTFLECIDLGQGSDSRSDDCSRE